ncbi:uncharacterized protein YndB with AHSA1/START domain [Glaciihabitans tibetensis]|uniref:Uncharacterized protein YndB with AHSA1/START domain n=1 Tax=Glaciihabitans tibetensis TaxID=1266600 RepID=A0A2T0VEN7_9MICO|nr:SRPBCC domain-containing protein [Glaciihabitans tibetensis]PRY68600.1 uncharacterized protein YndB with AHSA1/START domain [Glaciihabitans tibetensis]
MAGNGTTFEVRASRQLPVPVADAYAAWTESDQVTRWWGPTGFTCPLAEMDVRPGGVSLIAMRAPAEFGGGDMYNTWSYGLVEPPHRLEYEMRFATSDGTVIRPADAGIPAGVPDAVPHVVTFEAVGDDRSRVTVVESGYTDEQSRDLSQGGLEQCLDKLEKVLRVTA